MKVTFEMVAVFCSKRLTTHHSLTQFPFHTTQEIMGIDGNLPLPAEAAARPQYFLGIEGSANKVRSR